MTATGRFWLPRHVERLIEIASKWRIVRGIGSGGGTLPLSPFAVCRPRLGLKKILEEYHAWHAGRRPVFPKNTRLRAIEELDRKVPGRFCGRAGRDRPGGRRSDGAAQPQTTGRSCHGEGSGRNGASPGAERKRLHHAAAARDGGRENHGARDRGLFR